MQDFSRLKQLYARRPAEVTLLCLTAALLGFWCGYAVAGPLLMK